MKRCILFFIKLAETGIVKTRLARETSPQLACDLYAAVVEELLEQLESIKDTSILICHAPEARGDAVRAWLGAERQYLRQKGAELGRRMENGFRETFFLGYEQVVLVRSDVPALEPAIIHKAFEALEEGQVPLAGTTDGGYYLVGFTNKVFSPKIFPGLDWNSSSVKETTEQRLVAEHCTITQLPTLRNLSTLSDVQHYLEEGQTEGAQSAKIAQKMI